MALREGYAALGSPPPHILDWDGYDALASELGGGSAMHHFDRPSRNRSRSRLIPLRPYSVMVFFRSSFPLARE